MGDDYFIGLDIGGTKCAVVLGRSGDESSPFILGRSSFPTEAARGPGHVLARVPDLIRRLLGDRRVSPGLVRGIGICCGGPLDSTHGVILSPPNLPGWDHISIVQILQGEFGVPVRLRNDADACALAEWQFGAGRGTRNMIFCTFGTGFGAGLILDGRLYSGTSGMAGEIGHVRLAPDGPVGYGKRGSAEGFCSGGGMAQLARQYVLACWQRGQSVSFCATPAELQNLDAQAVGEAARAGDPTARDIYREAGKWLGHGLSILIDLLNPEMIVIGSIFARQQELLWPEAARVIAEEALSLSVGACRVVPAALGEQLGDYASLAVAIAQS